MQDICAGKPAEKWHDIKMKQDITNKAISQTKILIREKKGVYLSWKTILKA